MAKTKTEQKQKVDITWLQCQMPRPDWDNLNARRLALKVAWADVVVPGTKQYLDNLEAASTQQAVDAKKTNKAEKTAPKKPAKQSPQTTKSKKAMDKIQAEAKPEGGKFVDTILEHIDVK